MASASTSISMLEYFYYALGGALGLFLADRLFLYMEAQGWIYYRKVEPKGGTGSALEDLNAFLRPSVKHVQEMKERVSESRDSQGNGEPPSDDPTDPDHHPRRRG